MNKTTGEVHPLTYKVNGRWMRYDSIYDNVGSFSCEITITKTGGRPSNHSISDIVLCQNKKCFFYIPFHSEIGKYPALGYNQKTLLCVLYKNFFGSHTPDKDHEQPACPVVNTVDIFKNGNTP